MSDHRAVDFLLRTDLLGRVLVVPEAAPHWWGRLAPGVFLAELVADGSAGALLDFLLSVRREGAAVSSSLELARSFAVGPAEAPIRFVLGGVLRADGLLVWAASSHAAARERGAAALAPESGEGSTMLSAAARRLFGGPSAVPSSVEVEGLRQELAGVQAEARRLREELEQLRSVPH